jgi:hypothetical protein
LILCPHGVLNVVSTAGYYAGNDLHSGPTSLHLISPILDVYGGRSMNFSAETEQSRPSESMRLIFIGISRTRLLASVLPPKDPTSRRSHAPQTAAPFSRSHSSRQTRLQL